jgi:uncharacterized delta-60 repeat protein
VDHDFAFARFGADGFLDASFDADGKAFVPFDDGPEGDEIDVATSVAIDSSGRVVACGLVDVDAAGNNGLGIVRLTSAGAPDPSFSGDGKVLFPPQAGQSIYSCEIAAQPGGALIIAWKNLNQPSPGLLRLLPDGTPDPGFGLGGLVGFPCPAEYSDCFFTGLLLAPPDAKPVLTGFAWTSGLEADLLVAALNSNGWYSKFLDADENDSSEYPIGLGFQHNGFIVVAAHVFAGSVDEVRLTRLDRWGEVDEAFGDGGWAVANLPRAAGEDQDPSGMLVATDDRIVLYGSVSSASSSDCVVARFLPGGNGIDATFGASGSRRVSYNGGALEESCTAGVETAGRVAVAGFALFGDEFNFTVARLTEGVIFDDDFEMESTWRWGAP